MTEDDIAHYLSLHPEFFDRHSELLATVQLTSPHSRRAVSLQERQAEMLREKIKMLESRIMEMIRHGNDNLALSDRLLRWAGELLLATNPSSLPDTVVDTLQSRFSVPQVALKLWGLAPEHAELPCAQGVSEDAQLFANSLREPYCGVNAGFEATGWLPLPDMAASMALLALRTPGGGATTPAFGLLVLASPDAQRFASTLATDYLQRICDVASAALSRLR